MMIRESIKIASCNLSVKKMSNSSGELFLIFVPGYFSASSLGPNRLYVEIENSLQKHIKTSYRIDWPGMGDACGNLHEHSFNDLSNELVKLINHTRQSTEDRNISIITHSMGCHITNKALLSINQNSIQTFMLSPISKGQHYELLLGDIEDAAGIKYRKAVAIHNDFISHEWWTPPTIEEYRTHTIYCTDDEYIDKLDMSTNTTRHSKKIVTFSTGGHNYLTLESKFGAIEYITRSIHASSNT